MIYSEVFCFFYQIHPPFPLPTPCRNGSITPSVHACVFAAVEGHRQLPDVRIEHCAAAADAGGLEENGCEGVILWEAMGSKNASQKCEFRTLPHEFAKW